MRYPAVVSERQPEQSPRGLGSWAGRNLLASLTILGVVLYGLIRLWYQAFYGPFGLAPEDVGLDYAETLARSAGLIVWLTILLAPFVVLFVLLRERARRFVLALRSSPSFPRWLLDALAPLAILLAVFALFGLAAVGSERMIDSASDAKRGEVGDFPFGMNIGANAEPAAITWIEEPPDGLDDLASHRLMYLGQSEGTAFLYDIDSERTVQIPSNSALISLIRNERDR